MMYELKLSNNSILCGAEKGIKERERLELDKVECDDGIIILIIPETVTSISTSFIMGLFTDSLNSFDTKVEFYSKYKFISDDDFVKMDIADGVEWIYDHKSYCLKYNKKEKKKKKKVGRPKMDDSERKSKGYRIRLTKEEFDSLEKMSKITGLNKSDIIREALKSFEKELEL